MQTKIIQKLIATTILAVAAIAPAAAAPIVYMTGTGNPWGIAGAGSNETAMNTAFGAGQWVKQQGFTMAAFAADTKFLFLDGGDAQANQFSSFLNANGAAISAFVNHGGKLFLNAAPNEGGAFSMGFGATMNYVGYGNSASATAAGLATDIFNGIATSYTGSYFSHAYVTAGANFVSMMQDESGRSVFGGMHVGGGYVALGGMTLPYFHSPTADSAQLLANMLNYVADRQDVPEPGTAFLVGLGLCFAAFGRRRKA